MVTLVGLLYQMSLVLAQGEWYLNLISSAAVNTAPEYRKSNVPSATASSIVKHAIDGVLAMPQFTAIVGDVVDLGVQANGNINPSQALSLIRKASVSLANARPESSYSSLLAYVSRELPKFDSTAIDGSHQANTAEQHQQISQGIDYYNSFTRNPDGYSAVVTAMQMGREVIHDAHLPEPSFLEGTVPPSINPNMPLQPASTHRTHNTLERPYSSPTQTQQQASPATAPYYPYYPYAPNGEPYYPYGYAPPQYSGYGYATAPYYPNRPEPGPNYYNPYYVAPQPNNPNQNGPYRPYG